MELVCKVEDPRFGFVALRGCGPSLFFEFRLVFKPIFCPPKGWLKHLRWVIVPFCFGRLLFPFSRRSLGRGPWVPALGRLVLVVLFGSVFGVFVFGRFLTYEKRSHVHRE